MQCFTARFASNANHIKTGPRVRQALMEHRLPRPSPTCSITDDFASNQLEWVSVATAGAKKHTIIMVSPRVIFVRARTGLQYVTAVVAVQSNNKLER